MSGVDQIIIHLGRLRDKQPGFGMTYHTESAVRRGGAEITLYGNRASAAHWLMENADNVIAALRASGSSAPATVTESARVAGLTPAEAWQDLVEKDDRTSPDEYPDMALITFEELHDYMQAATPSAGLITGEAEHRLSGGLERFKDDVTDVQSRIIIVHQLRAVADIMDSETKRIVGWADTSTRAILMRKAADTIERFASRSSDGSVAPCGSGPSNPCLDPKWCTMADDCWKARDEVAPADMREAVARIVRKSINRVVGSHAGERPCVTAWEEAPRAADAILALVTPKPAGEV